jgi:hypothetical protein
LIGYESGRHGRLGLPCIEKFVRLRSPGERTAASIRPPIDSDHPTVARRIGSSSPQREVKDAFRAILRRYSSLLPTIAPKASTSIRRKDASEVEGFLGTVQNFVSGCEINCKKLGFFAG